MVRRISSASGEAAPREPATAHPTNHARDLFQRVLHDLGERSEDTAFVLNSLPDPFTQDELEVALATLHDQIVTRQAADPDHRPPEEDRKLQLREHIRAGHDA